MVVTILNTVGNGLKGRKMSCLKSERVGVNGSGVSENHYLIKIQGMFVC